MKKLTLTFAMLCAFSGLAFAGTTSYSGKEMQQTAPACPPYYADSEFALAVWGAYAFGGDNGDDLGGFDFAGDFRTESRPVRDSAAGGGVDAKYFFFRNWGIGVEGFGLGNLNKGSERRRAILKDSGFTDVDSDGAGAALLTLTYRFPMQCSHWSPYVWGGLGGLWGRDDSFVFVPQLERFKRTAGDEGQFLGQIGGGIEYRFSTHIGAMLDLSWNIAEDDNFGMVRGGLTFAF